jgi:DNA mismatch repair protein MutL
VGIIRVLPEKVSNKIAAGEVIEGPFSIVRELIDNSLDAEATHVKIVVNNGGKDFIRITDDGIGMSKDDAILSIQKHTTSKIEDIEDLEILSTLGFRGEALSSICTVSDFTMVTRRNEEDIGVKLSCSYGKDLKTEPTAANIGSEMTVKNLFYNFPARRKFLKSNRAENVRIKDEVVKKSICFFNRGFSLSSDDRNIFRLIPRKNYRDRIADIFGKDLQENLSNISHEDDLFTIQGYLSNKNNTLSNRRGQYIFINNRPIIDRALYFALNGPARGIIEAGRYVYAFIYINIRPSLIDVNVHPSKKEIKIKIEKNVYSVLYKLVENILQSKFYPSFPEDILNPERTVRENLSQRDMAFHTERSVSFESRDWEKNTFDKSVESKVPKISIDKGGFDSIELFSEELVYRGSLFHTYIIFEGKDFILFIDQHAAHERVLYEAFRKKINDNVSVKMLLIPINFTPPRLKYAQLLECIDIFKEAGIEIEPFGDESFNILSIPAIIPEKREEESLSCLFDEFYSGKISPNAHELREKFIELAACRGAVKEGDALNANEARALLTELMGTEVPYVCPHGRPTYIQLTKDYFEKVFKRR